MTRRLALALGLLVLPLPAVGGTVVVRPEVDLDAGSVTEAALDARPGDEIRVELPTRGGTGYSWTGLTRGAGLVRSGATATMPADPGRPGGAGLEVFTYSATSPGSATLAFHYTRPWEKAGPAASVRVAVEVHQ